MTTTKGKSVMSRIRNNKGFTLIEMAIVLVIIGIILGAVMKGQDLISNSKSKGVTSVVSNWKALVYTYVDRNSRMPGDSTRTGKINLATAGNEAMFQLYSSMSSAPTNPVVVGGTSYWVYLLNDSITNKNTLMVCTNATCTQAFSNDDAEIFKAVDASIDGGADGAGGNFRAYNALATVGAGANFRGDASKKILGAGENSPSVAATHSFAFAAATFGPWGEATNAAVYYFDKSY